MKITQQIAFWQELLQRQAALMYEQSAKAHSNLLHKQLVFVLNGWTSTFVYIFLLLSLSLLFCQGSIQQLVIKPDPRAAEEQCEEDDPSVSAFPLLSVSLLLFISE